MSLSLQFYFKIFTSPDLGSLASVTAGFEKVAVSGIDSPSNARWIHSEVNKADLWGSRLPRSMKARSYECPSVLGGPASQVLIRKHSYVFISW